MSTPGYIKFDDRDSLGDTAIEIARVTGRDIESSRWSLFGERLHASLLSYIHIVLNKESSVAN